MLKIFNTLGEEVRTLVDEQREASYHAVRWDSKDKNGKVVASGVYLYQLQECFWRTSPTDLLSKDEKMFAKLIQMTLDV